MTEEPWKESQVFGPSRAGSPLCRPFVPLLLPPSGLSLLPAPPQMPPRPGRGLPFEFCPRGLQTRPLPRRVGRPGDARRDSEPRHFPFPSTCPTSAPGLGLHPRAASVPVPEPRTEVARVREVGGRGRGGAGRPVGAPPRRQDPTPPHTQRLNGERATHKARAKTLALRPQAALLAPPPSWSHGLAGEGGSVLPPWPVRGLRLPGEVPASPGLAGGAPRTAGLPPFLLLLPLLPHVSSRSPAA